VNLLGVILLVLGLTLIAVGAVGAVIAAVGATGRPPGGRKVRAPKEADRHTARSGE
jgi:hypothetical protein